MFYDNVSVANEETGSELPYVTEQAPAVQEVWPRVLVGVVFIGPHGGSDEVLLLDAKLVGNDPVEAVDVLLVFRFDAVKIAATDRVIPLCAVKVRLFQRLLDTEADHVGAEEPLTDVEPAIGSLQVDGLKGVGIDSLVRILAEIMAPVDVGKV